MKREKRTMDGNQAAAHVSYAYSDVAAIYPITPSSTMAEVTDEWASEGRENIFGQKVHVVEMQSETGAAGTVHGALVAGALTTTYTASQGLLLMIPNLYKIVGEHLPGVFNVAARAIASHALSIFGDHSDIYACRQTGVCMLASGSVQEVMDLTPVAHLAAIKGRLPFINFFDGFRTSHEIQKIDVWEYDTLREMLDMEAVTAFRQHALNPNHARSMGSAQNPDVFFQVREASNPFFLEMPGIVEQYMHYINQELNTSYELFSYYGAEDATQIIIAMGSVCQTIEETVDYLNHKGARYGVVEVHLYRPFSREHLIRAIPETVEKITVLDRTKEPGAMGEPLYLDVVAALRDSRFHDVHVFSGRYGLGSKDTNPDQIAAVFANEEKSFFTIGIEDDVTHLSLSVQKNSIPEPSGRIRAKFWGFGSDGTVGANKNSIKIIGNHTNNYVQAYFDYDSKKSGGVTVSHLRISSEPIKSTYLVYQADFVACHKQSYIDKYDCVQDVRPGGTFLLNCTWNQEQLEQYIPEKVKRYIAENHIAFYTIDGIRLGKEIGLNGKINTILQAAFFALTDVLPTEDAIQYMKEAAKDTYQKKGDVIVQMNYDAIDAGATSARRIPDAVMAEISSDDTESDGSENVDKVVAVDREQKSQEALAQEREEVLRFAENIQQHVNIQQGNHLPVSAFVEYADGSVPAGTAAHERRNIAIDLPSWIPENCIQCNRCSFVCPHAVIRPAVMTEEELQAAPGEMKTIPMNGMPEQHYAITISNVDCTGCSACATVCPGKGGRKALVMEETAELSAELVAETQEQFDYAKRLPKKPEVLEKFKPATVKGSQFKQPLLEFSGACAGCGETPYAKLVTQLFGDRMYIANATGCSSIWGNSMPSTPYTTDAQGKGPAWSNSLFEDAAEFGYGMLLAQNSIRDKLRNQVMKLSGQSQSKQLEDAVKTWLATYQNGAENGPATDYLIETLEHDDTKEAQEILKEKDFLSKKSQWVFGGDGWAYDIGFGGLDHVLASGQNMNILVFDTEMYSNTGGQSSKATQAGAIAKFAAGGKAMGKKDLASIAMSYGYVYVAQIAMGADYNQCIKAIIEAESYEGPSLIIAYAPCISHGIKAGMASAQNEEEKAVQAGYWHLFRYHPARKATGENAFILDSKAPTLDYQEFLAGEVRYDALKRGNPEKAKELFQQAANRAEERNQYLQKLVALYGTDE